MLKFTYSENGFHLEHLTESVEDWVITRLIVFLRAGTSLYIQPSTASFLLPVNLAECKNLLVLSEQEDILSVCDADTEYIEVTLQGTWIAADSDTEEGIFVVAMSQDIEVLLFKLWWQSVNCASVALE